MMASFGLSLDPLSLMSQPRMRSAPDRLPRNPRVCFGSSREIQLPWASVSFLPSRVEGPAAAAEGEVVAVAAAEELVAVGVHEIDSVGQGQGEEGEDQDVFEVQMEVACGFRQLGGQCLDR